MNKKVSKKSVGKNVYSAVKDSIDDLGGIANFVKAGEKVLLKPNFNTADPFPASTSVDFLRAVVRLVMSQKPSEVIIGDSSTMMANTKKVMKKIGIYDLAQEFKKLTIISFDDEKWVEKKVLGGKYLKSVSVPERLEQIDKLILLPCLKTHFITRYTGALKLSVGFMKTGERAGLHLANIQKKIAELNLVIKPDLIIMDARKCFITKGPMKGEVRMPGMIMASESRIQIDKRGVEIIKSFSENDLMGVSADDLIQIKYANELGVD